MAATGIELLFHVIRNDLSSKEDSLVALFHWLMIRNGFKCVGSSDQWTEDCVQSSELLPSGWNANQDSYSLRYILEANSKRFLLKVVRTGSSLQINLLDIEANSASGITANTDEHVSSNFTDFSALKGTSDLENQFKKMVLKKMPNMISAKDSKDSKASKEIHQTQRPHVEEEGLDLRVPESANRPQSFVRPDPFSVGRSDLDPLNRGMGGGMIMDPRHAGPHGIRPHMPDHNWGVPGNLPRGAVPPGARFDPFGPVNPGRFSRPNPDHLPPPNYDDMFM